MKERDLHSEIRTLTLALDRALRRPACVNAFSRSPGMSVPRDLPVLASAGGGVGRDGFFCLFFIALFGGGGCGRPDFRLSSP